MVEEINFVEPCAWRTGKKPVKRTSSMTTSAPKMESLQVIKKQVVDFGATARTKREKKEAEEKRAVALGCTPAKRPKVPLPILKGQRQKQKERAKFQKQYEREHELVTANTSKSKRRGKH